MTQSQAPEDEIPPRKTVCVGAVVVVDDRVLFVRQAAGHSLAGQWSIPWGYVESDESPEDAAVRETLEESNVKARVIGLLGIQNLDPAGWLGIAFLCSYLAGDPRPDDKETDAVAWFTLTELAQDIAPFEPWSRWLALRMLRGVTTLIRPVPENPFPPRLAFL